MSHDFVTIAIKFDAARIDAVEKVLCVANLQVRERLNALQGAEAFVHFMSTNVVRHEPESDCAHLVIEASMDGNANRGMELLVKHLSAEIDSILKSAGLDPGPSLLDYLEQNRLRLGAGWFVSPAVMFVGAPSLTVARIRKEADLAARLSELLRKTDADASPLSRLEQVRQAIFEDVHFKWALVADAIPLLGPAPKQRAWPVIRSFLGRYAWPALIPVTLAVLGALWLKLGVSDSVRVASAVALAEVAVLIAFLSFFYFRVRSEEHRAPPEQTLATARFEQIMARENRISQNHLAGVSRIKPGRRLILRLVLWLVGARSKYHGTPGLLSDVSGIHFARWLVLPGTDKLLFYSNYDGSWMGYLEDFIAKAHHGLTAIWSNTRDFPRTHRLIEGGASDGARFKLWARLQQQPTLLWYSAYPNLTMKHIRAHAAIRHGLATITSDVEAARWLERFGIFSQPAPIELHDAPTLAFGGLSRLRHSHCMIVELSAQESDCRGWLKAIEPSLSFGEQTSVHRAAVLAFSPSGLRKLGMNDADLGTFPAVFRNGMTAASRARVLGDVKQNAPENWAWGGNGGMDAVFVLYAENSEDLHEDVRANTQLLAQWGHAASYEIEMEPLPPKGHPVREPFNFIDGISQPVMRGTRLAAMRNPIHVVEPGELLLGYANNLGYTIPSPRFEGMDVGRNGTYLVVRQLQQDKAAFEDYLSVEAASMANSPHRPNVSPAELREWIAAKMVGRWRQDGSSMVRYPNAPATTQRGRPEPDNDFLFGVEDPNGLRCPFGSHIRRANPRDSFDAGSQLQMKLTNRHRILRVGRSYRAREDRNAGLLFMCVNADIESQFEFVQQSWLLGSSFHGLKRETDAMTGRQPMTIPTPNGPLTLRCLPDFVTVRGGGYFFLPARSAVRTLLRNA